MVFHVMFQMTSTHIPFSLFCLHVSLYTVAMEDLLATHKRLVPTLALCLSQSQSWASLPHTPSKFPVNNTLMLSPRVIFLIFRSAAKPGPSVATFGCCTEINPCLVQLIFRPNPVTNTPAFTLVICGGCSAFCFRFDSPRWQRACVSLDIASVMSSKG